MNTIRCPSCGESLPAFAHFCALCGKQLTTSEQRAIRALQEPITSIQPAYIPAHIAVSSTSIVDEDEMSSPTIAYPPPTVKFAHPPANISQAYQHMPAAPALVETEPLETDPTMRAWPQEYDDGQQTVIAASKGSTREELRDEDGLEDEPQRHATWHKELDTPSLHLNAPLTPRPSSPQPVVLRKQPAHQKTGQRYRSPYLFFWLSLGVLLILVLGGFFGLFTTLGHGLFGTASSGVPTLSASATTLGLGGTLTLHGSHFTPNGQIGLSRDASIAINDTHAAHIIRADAQGTFTDSLVVLTDWQPGPHTINAEDALRHKIARVSLLLTGQAGPSRPAHFKLSTDTLNMGIGDTATNSEQIVTITNIGGSQLSWQGRSNQTWLLFSPTQGTLASGEQAQVTIAADRNGMSPGNYKGQMLFTSNAGNTTLAVQMQVIPLNPQSHGVLAVSPSVLSFTGTDGANPPASQNVTLSNPGTQSLQWNVSSDQPWLQAAPSSGSMQGTSGTVANTGNNGVLGDISLLSSAPQQSSQGAPGQVVAVSVNTGALLPGTYNGTLTFTAHGPVKDATQQVIVNLTVQPQCGIQVSPSLLTFTSAYQQPGPPSQPVSVTTTAGCTSPVQWSVSSDSSWLTVNTTSGTTPASPQASVNVSGLNVGTYNGSLVFTTSSGTQTVPVTLTIGQASTPALSVDTLTMNFSATVGGTSPLAQVANVSNSGGGTLSWKATTATAVGGNWLTTTSTTSSLSTKQSGTVSVSAKLLSTLVPGVYNGTVTLTGTDASGNVATGSPQVIQVTFTVYAPCAATVLPTTLAFSGVAGTTSVTPQPVTLTASGACANALSWSATSSSAWLVPATTTGTFSLSSPGSISVGVSLGTLTPGTYTGTLTVSVADSVTGTAIGTPQKITATLTVQTPCTLSTPTPTSLAFNAETGQSTPAQSFTVGVSGACVGNVTITPSVTLSSGTGWLTVTPSSASIAVGSSATFSVTASAASVAAGSYTASISLAGVNGTATIAGSPQVVGVSFAVAAAPALSASASTTSTHGTGDVTEQSVIITNTGGNALSWSASLASNTPSFISLASNAGSLTGGATGQIDLVVDTAHEVSGSYPIAVTVTATDPTTGTAVSGSPTTVTVNVTVAQPSLLVSSTDLVYSTNQGSNPAAQTLSITNNGGGTLSWTIGSLSASWLSVDTASGSDGPGASSTVTVSVNAASLAPGTYSGSFVVTAGSQSATVNVSVTVNAVATPTPTPVPTTAPTPTPTTVAPTPTATAGVTPTPTAGVTPTATAAMSPTASATKGTSN